MTELRVGPISSPRVRMVAFRYFEFEDGRRLSESDAILWYLSEDTFPYCPPTAGAALRCCNGCFFEQYSHETLYRCRPLSGSPLRRKRSSRKKRHLIHEWHAKGNAAPRRDAGLILHSARLVRRR